MESSRGSNSSQPWQVAVPSLVTSDSDTLTRTALNSAVSARFCESYFPRNETGAHERYISDGITAKTIPPVGGWIDVVRNIAHLDDSLRFAFEAISCVVVGRQYKDDALSRQGVVQYGKALREVNRALVDSTRVHSDAVLTACGLLATYEVCDSIR